MYYYVNRDNDALFIRTSTITYIILVPNYV